TRARIAVANRRREPGTRSTSSTRPSLRPRTPATKGFGQHRIREVRWADDGRHDPRPAPVARHRGHRRPRPARRRRYRRPRPVRGRRVIVFRFGPEDLGRVRFALSPVIELVSSLDVLREPAAHSIHSPWAYEAQGRVADVDFRL